MPDSKHWNCSAISDDKISLCPGCNSPLLQLDHFQAIPGGKIWQAESFCPDCHTRWVGEVCISQLCSLIESFERAATQLMLEANRLQKRNR